MFSFLRRRDGTPRFSSFLSSKPLLLLISVFDYPRAKIRALYRWVVGWADTRQSEWALAGISFVESSFFPIPPDPLLIAMTVAQPRKYMRYAVICTVASVLGGLAGYLIGWVLFDTIGRWIIDGYGLQQAFETVGQRYSENAFLAVFTAALTPIPYKVFTIAAGVFLVNVPVFVLASVLGRGLRFFAVAILMHHFGQRYKDAIEKYVDLLSLAFVALLILGLVLVRYL